MRIQPAGHLHLGLLILRVFLAVRLIYGVQDNIFHWHHMKAFEAFLGQSGFAYPLAAAVISVYAQAIAGVLLFIGWFTRWAAILMVINFAVALIMVHLGQSFEEMTTVLFMLVTAAVIFLTGAGKYSVDRG